MPVSYHLCKTLAGHGVAALRFDFTALGNSDGDFSAANFSHNIEDILAAANYLKENYQAPSLLLGHSLGGTAMLAAASQIKSAKAIATIASPYAPSHVLLHFEEAVEKLKKQAQTSIRIMDQEFDISQEFITDIQSYEQSNFVENLDIPLLIMHSPGDKIVDIREATKLFSSARHPKSFLSLGEIDHMLSNKADAVYAAEIIYAWAQRYLD